MSARLRRLTGAVAALFALAWAGAALALPPVWVVKSKSAEVVLFGSIHILPPGLGWEPPELERALKRADDLWFELPIDAKTAADRLAVQAAGRRGQHAAEQGGPGL